MTLQFESAIYADDLGQWPTSITLASGKYRVPIRGIVFAGPLDGLKPQLDPDEEPRLLEDWRNVHGHGWRPTPTLLRRFGDRYEAQTPDGAHRGRVVTQAADRIGNVPEGGWPPVPVHAGYAYDGSAILELCRGRLEFTIGVSIGEDQLDGQIGVQVDIARSEARLIVQVGETTYTTEWVTELEVALGHLATVLGPQRYLRRCFFCMFSDYSYSGTGLSGMACFRDARHQYLAVRSKGDYMQLYPRAVTEWVDELYICPEFTPRVPGTGYRG